VVTSLPDTDAMARRERRLGLTAALAAFTIWGGMPAYLRPLASVPALQIAANRALFCCAVVLAFLAIVGGNGPRDGLVAVRAALVDRAVRSRLALTATCMSINWLLFVWAVAHGHVIEASLGYFINPLLNVLLGVVVLRERLNRVQLGAVALAGVAVLYLTWQAGRPPWIALVLAGSFAMYGLLRKTAGVEALAGLAAETLLIAPFAASYLIWLELTGQGALGHSGGLIDALLLGSGVVTAVPLACFSYGARRIPYSTIGVLQYVGPTLQLFVGLWIYGEPLSPARLLGFALIWLALALYAADGLLRRGLARADS
jgi:chloramphenicol-sensitive protein RarD